MMKTAVAIRHVHFEDLGLIQPVLEKAGYNVHVYDAGVDELWTLDAIRTDLVVVLGGPIGAYDDDRYPFLADELRLLEQRLASNKPTLGICLGAQLMARVMGADVYAGNGKEIGWSALELTPDGRWKPRPALAWRHVRLAGEHGAAGVDGAIREPSLLAGRQCAGSPVSCGGRS
jgi:GMP synthase (glutamine-hydrolysing)